MPSTRLLVLGIVVGAVLLAIVLGAAIDALRQSFRAQSRAAAERPPAPPRPPAAKRPNPIRYAPTRTRLHWYSPEILAVLLLSLAAGLWLARLAG